MQKEYVPSGNMMRLLRAQILIMVVLGVGTLCFAIVRLLVTSSDLSVFGIAAFILLMALGFQIMMKRTQQTTVVVEAEGLRYGHLPQSPLVPWTQVQSVRERPLAGRLNLVDAQGETCFYIEQDLKGFAELRELVLEKVPLALPRPIRFRRSWWLDSLLIFFALVLCSALFTDLWFAVGVIPMIGFYLIAGEGKSPYAIQVTDSELILSFVFRTLTIPLGDLKFTSATENHKGVVHQILHVVDPESKRDIVIRNVGVDMIVLKATVQEAIRTRPLARSFQVDI